MAEEVITKLPNFTKFYQINEIPTGRHEGRKTGREAKGRGVWDGINKLYGLAFSV
jgi:hypothetical protein